MMDETSLANHFLIAMPSLEDPNFQRSVTFICEHNENGAMGIVINRPTGLSLGEVLEHMEIPSSVETVRQQPVYAGGPVQMERGFVLHRPPGEWSGMMRISQSIGLTTSRDILEAISADNGPDESVVALGYAGWAPGQLEQELAANAWLNGPADEHIIFETPHDERWRAAAALLGVDLELLSTEVGHA